MLSGDLLGHRARLTPDWVALVDADTGDRFRYRDLNERANRLTNFLIDGLGLRKGDRFAILAHNCVSFIDALYAAGKAGLILVPLGWRLTPSELGYQIGDCAPRVILYGSELVPAVEVTQKQTTVEHWVALGERARASDRSYENELARASARPPGEIAIDPEDACAILYTSGTTGRPKGAMIPHRMLLFNGYNTAVCWGLQSNDVCPIFTPLYHAGGLSAFLVPLFTIGGRIVLHKGFDPGEIWRTMEKEGATVALGVPTVWKMLMDAPEFQHADLRTVRFFASGGAPLPRYIIDAFQQRGIVFKQGFGMTEVGVNCFAMTVEESYRKAGSVGKPFMFTQVRLVGEDGLDVPVGGIGELTFRGPHVFSGYWNKSEATAAVIEPGGWFHTGDLARADEDGFYYIVGRSKDMFISGGVNVYPAEIEGELVHHPEVADAAVIGVADEKWGEVGVAFVVRTAGSQVSDAELVAYLDARLARYKIPRRYVYVDTLPRTAYGKVVKAQLHEQLEK